MNWLKLIFEGNIGYAVEAGAFDGIFLSNTLELEQAGWQCLCIEPNPHVWEDLKKNRKLCQPYALLDSDVNNVDFEVRFFGASGEAGLSSISLKDEMRNRYGPGIREKKVVKVNCRTLDRCLTEAGFIRVDFISIDVEGWELEVLNGFDFARWHPKLLYIENIFTKSEYRDYLYHKGYVLVDREIFNDIYLHKELIMPTFSKLEIDNEKL